MNLSTSSETVYYDAKSDRDSNESFSLENSDNSDHDTRTPSPVEKLSQKCEASEVFYDIEPGDTNPTTPSRNWFKWGNTSPSLLKASEDSLLEVVATPIKGFFVNLGPIIDENDSKIWTIVLNEDISSNDAPIVLIHGLGAGIGLWAKNLDELAKLDRRIYAIDVLGFGRSSRTKFSNSDAHETEKQFVISLEAWREKIGLEKMILLGHSLGGYISTSYALSHPLRVNHLILADPWGFNTQPSDLKEISHIPFHHRVIVKMMEPLNPLWTIRLLGPVLAPKLIQRIRADLISQFSNVLVDASTKISNYIYHCNVQNPTGESAFHTMMVKFGWAKNAMVFRIHKVDKSIPITFIYGSRSWVDHCSTDKIKEIRPNSVVNAFVLDAGHHIYADQAEDFNEIVCQICRCESSTAHDENDDDDDVTIFDKTSQRKSSVFGKVNNKTSLKQEHFKNYGIMQSPSKAHNIENIS